MSPDQTIVLPAKETTFIYLHGFLSGPDSTKARYFAEQLAVQGQTVLRPDLKGKHPAEMTLTSQLRIVENLVTRAEGSVVILGSSLGAYLALIAAERHRKVRRLILMAPAFDFPRRFPQLFSPEQLQEWKNQGEQLFFFYSFGEERPLSYRFMEDLETYRSFSFRRQLPVQIFHGIRDEIVPYSLSIDYLHHHPMCDLVLLNTDHGMLDKMDIMWEYMKVFLQQSLS